MHMGAPEELIAVLHRENASAMAQYAYRLTGDPEIAQDLVQETFLTAILKKEQLSAHPAPRLWLFTTLRYKIMREMDRAYRRAEKTPVDEEKEAAAPPLEKLSDSLPRELSDREREILTLRFEEERSYLEIAEKEGVAEAACRQQVSRAVRHCRALLEREKGTSDKPCVAGCGGQEAAK